jgi:hypothetical protein
MTAVFIINNDGTHEFLDGVEYTPTYARFPDRRYYRIKEMRTAIGEQGWNVYRGKTVVGQAYRDSCAQGIFADKYHEWLYTTHKGIVAQNETIKATTGHYDLNFSLFQIFLGRILWGYKDKTTAGEKIDSDLYFAKSFADVGPTDGEVHQKRIRERDLMQKIKNHFDNFEH